MNKQPVIKIFDVLYSKYGPQGWWPGDSRFEIIVGAILTQNTNWRNVAHAITNLKEADVLNLNALLSANPERIKALIAPSGFFNMKYKRLRNVLEYLAKYGMDSERFYKLPVADLRGELLEINGVGPETADSILLYAFDRPVFVVDAYTRRLFSRIGHDWMAKGKYEDIQKFFMEELPTDPVLYNEFHALIVAHCKTVCKKIPLCSDCALSSLCMTAINADSQG